MIKKITNQNHESKKYAHMKEFTNFFSENFLSGGALAIFTKLIYLTKMANFSQQKLISFKEAYKMH